MLIKPSKTVIRRGILFLAASLVLWLVLMIRLFVLQVVKYDSYHKLVVDNITSSTTISASRGIIYDCNMTELAYDVPVERVFISPCDIANEEQKLAVCENLSQLLEVDYDTILEKANKKERQDETVKTMVEKEDADRVRAFVTEYNALVKKQNESRAKDDQLPILSCIHFAETSKRYYPFGSLGAQTIGFTGSDGQGLFGLELAYNSYLQGVSGKIITAVNAKGGSMPTKYESYIDAENGYNIVTTIDYKIQSILDNYVEETFYDNGAGNRACGVVMNCKTGAILALSTYPNFDLNDPYTLDDWSVSQLASEVPESDEYKEKQKELLMELWNNKCISYLYEPGSTFKVITSAIAFEEKKVNPYVDTFYCPGKNYVVDLGNGQTKTIGCHKEGGHGTVTYAVGLQQSCNPTLMQAAQRIGRQSFYKYFQAFGYTERTGVDLPGEYRSIYGSYSDFYITELCVYSFGQTFKVTPLQQLTGICTVANGGTLVTPYVVSKLTDDDGNVIKSFEPEARREVVSEDTCKLVTQILQEGVSGDGAAKNAYVKGYKIAAKTGTSQKQDKFDENGERPYRVGSCMAYGPVDDPQIAVLIICDEPSGSPYGSRTAAPYVARTVRDIFSYMNIEPVYTDYEKEHLAYQVSDYTGLNADTVEQTLKDAGLSVKRYGSGDIITSQMPQKGAQIQKDRGFVVLYTGGEAATKTVTVPSLIGWNESNAMYLTATNGLNLYVDSVGPVSENSASLSYKQSIAEGTEVPYGTPVTVYFQYTNLQDD